MKMKGRRRPVEMTIEFTGYERPHAARLDDAPVRDGDPRQPYASSRFRRALECDGSGTWNRADS